jgi:hypothetical protein
MKKHSFLESQAKRLIFNDYVKLCEKIKKDLTRFSVHYKILLKVGHAIHFHRSLKSSSIKAKKKRKHYLIIAIS